MIDAIETLRQRDAEVARLGIKAIGLEWHTLALTRALSEANAEITRLGGRPVPVPQSPLDGVQ